MDNLNSSPCDASNRKWSCPACTYLNWPNVHRCTQCETPRDNLNTILGSSPSLGSRRKANTKVRLTSIFEGLKLSELQSTNEENNRIGHMKNSPTSPRFEREETYCSTTSPSPAEVIDNTSPSCGLAPHEPSPLICQSIAPKESAFNFNNQTCGSSEYGLLNSSTYGAIGSNRSSSQTSIHWNSCEEESEGDSKEKWSCVLCTYDNWPRAIKCVMCLTPRGRTNSVHRVNSPDEGLDTNSYCPAQGNNRSAQTNQFPLSVNNRITTTGTNAMSHTQNSIVPNNRRTRELDRRWLDACNAVVDGNINLVEAYLAAGGDPSRQLTQTEVAILDRPSAFEVGLTLIHLALRFQQENLLATLLSQVDGTPTVVKRVPSAAAPDLAVEVRRHVMSIIRQRRGNFRCHVISEIATFTLPSEIEDYPTDLQETVFDEVLDRDVQKELDDGQIINWSTEIVESLNSRLYALWNRSAGDCLLDSVLQATWGIFDQDNGLRQALSDSLQECATMFYQRWKDNELIHAHLLQFSLNDSQCAADWANLVSIASKPGSSLEQLHIFVLAHILRRPIVVYGVKFVKSFRGENLGYARYEGLYVPFFWEPAFCYKSPICLGYTRGHFSALVTIEPDCDPMSSTGITSAQLVPPDISKKCSYLPLTSVDGNLLPIHFLSQSELGKEEMIMNQWLDVRYTDTGLMVACQQIQAPPLVVEMVHLWLNHYRRLGQVAGGGTFLRPPVASGYSSDESDD